MKRHPEIRGRAGERSGLHAGRRTTCGRPRSTATGRAGCARRPTSGGAGAASTCASGHHESAPASGEAPGAGRSGGIDMAERNLSKTSLGLTQDDYRRLCLRAFENLPSDTTVTMDDVDAILTWCLPRYDELKVSAPLRLTADGPGSRDEIATYIETVIEQNATPNGDTSAERIAQSLVTSVLHRLGAGYSVATGRAQAEDGQ